ncbi:MAG: DUF2301 domain-containing membrane protein [Leptolyngbyaceae cyanobacterium SL_7_1]|nr:DUF2301 domain-containing membrane protein [Leptolyngbyaceae cyanobacterium SL_7_1]
MSPTYQGQFGEFTITPVDRREVVIYRAGLMVAALSFAVATGLGLWRVSPLTLAMVSLLYGSFSIGLGISLLTIHIYLVALHRALQLFWLVGTGTAIAIALRSSQPLALTVYQHPLMLLGIGFTFAALTGVFFKEAFCFDRLETKVLTPLVPVLLLGHLLGILPVAWERGLISTGAVLFLVFALRKATQPIPPDIGDKSVFAYLKQRSIPT